MFSFFLSLIVLSVMFTVFAGAAFFIRKSLFCGREGRMYPIWIFILLLSIVPFSLRITLSDSLPGTDPFHSEAQNETDAAVHAQLQFQGDYGEILHARTLHYFSMPELPERLPEPYSPLELGVRRFLAASFRYLDDIAAVVFVLWLSGAAIRFAHIMFSYRSTTQLMLIHSRVCTDERIRRLLLACRKTTGLSRHVQVRMFDIGSVCSPCVVGCIRPVLFLDPSCADLSDRELICVLTHELTHIRRCDMLIKLFAAFVTSVHWFNPVSRHVQHAVIEDCELACDYHVVRAYGNEISSLYMNTILDFVERFSENSRLISRGGTSAGLFLGKPVSAAFLKRRYANMKNYRKDRMAFIITGAFTALCAVLNATALSSCSGITPGMIGSAIELTPPVEQMVRSYYGLSDDAYITPEMVDGITSLTVEVNETYNDHILVEFTAGGEKYQGEPLKCEPLPMIVIDDYFEDHILPAVEVWDAYVAENPVTDASGKQRKPFDTDKMQAFYQLKNPFDPELEPRAAQEMIAEFPPCVETSVYLRDPYASEREINALYQILDNAGLLDAWEIDSYTFDTTSFAYFANLSEVEFIGLEPVGYDFPDTVKVTISEKPANE